MIDSASRKAAEEALNASEQEMDQTELIKLLNEEMLQAAQNLEFERAAQLRDKVNELKGMPRTRGGDTAVPEVTTEGVKIWQPKNKGKPKRNAAK